MSVYKHKSSPYYQYDFQVGGHRFHGSTGCKNERDAKAVEKKQRDQAKAAVVAAKAATGGPLTLNFAVGRYWKEVGEHHANAATTWTDLCRLLDYLGPTTLLSNITDDDVAKMVQWRRAHRVRGRDKDNDGNPVPFVSPSTVNRSATLVLKKLFTRAKRTWRYSFPLEPIWRDHWLAEPKERVRELKSDESAALRLATRSDYAPVFEFARATGFRLDECLLKWSEVDWHARQIVTKGKGDRLVTTGINSTVEAILTPLIGHHHEWVFTYESKRTRTPDASYKGDGESRERGKRYPITYPGLKSQWKRIRKLAKVEDFRFHDFRHDVATKLLRQTGNLKLVQKALSHADIKTTTRYAHVLDEEVSSALDALAATQTRDTKSRKKSRTTKK